MSRARAALLSSSASRWRSGTIRAPGWPALRSVCQSPTTAASSSSRSAQTRSLPSVASSRRARSACPGSGERRLVSAALTRARAAPRCRWLVCSAGYSGAGDEVGEPAAGTDCAELGGIADGDGDRAGVCGVAQPPDGVACGHLRRLVEDEDSAGRPHLGRISSVVEDSTELSSNPANQRFRWNHLVASTVNLLR